jgi:hypothetical protein
LESLNRSALSIIVATQRIKLAGKSMCLPATTPALTPTMGDSLDWCLPLGVVLPLFG